MGVGRRATAVRRQRRTLLLALLASVLAHFGLLAVVRMLPEQPLPRTQTPLSFTLLERQAPSRPEPVPTSRPAPGLKGPPGRTSAADARRQGPVGPNQPDSPFAQKSTPGLSLDAMSKRSAEEVVRRRGPQHAPGDSVGERLAETLQRGTGAMAVARGGFWDGYFTSLRKVLLGVWSSERVQVHFSGRATTRVRLVLDAEGSLRDFEILLASGSPAMDLEVVQALHQTTEFPPPPEQVLRGKAELVTEWELTIHPALALKQGEASLRPLGAGMAFDLITLVNPSVDLTPLERNVALASYWTR